MLSKKILSILSLTVAGFAFAPTITTANVPISGSVESRCTIFTDTQGVYGNPSPSVLSTSRADGGVKPIIRFDVASADFYKAKIITPNSFSSSPSLPDYVNWTGDVTVKEVTDPLMADYETNKVQYDNVTEFDLTVSGTVWFDVESKAEYGVNKPFPGGNYTALVIAECIAK